MSNANETLDQILDSTPIETQEEQFVDPSKLSIKDVCKIMNQNYLELLDYVISSLHFDEDLKNSLIRDKKYYEEKVEKNGVKQIMYMLTDNFLYCLEAVKDHNSDYFAYQEDKIKKKSGKTEKVKISTLAGKTSMKKIIAESKEETVIHIFDVLVELFMFLCKKKENGYEFRKDYLEYVEEYFEDHRYYNKMKLMIDNVDSILSEYNPEDYKTPQVNLEESEEEENGDKKKKSKKNKKKKKDESNPFDFFTKSAGDNLAKSLESSNIGKIAKNISEKMNDNEFPMLKDPSQFLASLTNPNAENGLGDLIKFVMGEVQTSLQSNNLSHEDLMNEAQGMMGGLSQLTGIDPLKMMSEMGSPPGNGNGDDGMNNVPDFSQFAGIFEGLGKELQKSLDPENKE
jgi:hypothetical protein